MICTTIRLYDRFDNLLASMPIERYGLHLLISYLGTVIGNCVPRHHAEWIKLILGPATDRAIIHAQRRLLR